MFSHLPDFATGVRSFDGHSWPWLPGEMLRRQMADLHSLAVTR